MNNQGQTAAAIMSVIFLIAGFAVAGLLFTFTQVLGGQTYNLVESDIDEITSFTSDNETFRATNGTWVLAINNTASVRSIVILNGTDWSDVTTNFTVNTTTGRVLLTWVMDTDVLNNSICWVTYEYDDETIKNAIKAGILSNFEAQQQIGDYMPIIALAIIITIVIGLIIGGIASRFMSPQTREYGGYGNFL